jgi:hypothetical protein
MKKLTALATGAFVFVCPLAASGQEAPPAIGAAPAAAPVAVAQPAARMVIGQPSRDTVLPQGTSVRLRTMTPLSSQDNRVGDRFDLEVAEDVLLGGHIVIPRGSPGRGEVTLVRRKGMWGKSGRLETRLLSVRAHGLDIPIHGVVGERGETGTIGVVGAILVLPVAGFFVTGTSAVMPMGSAATGVTESDLPISFAAVAAVPR